jgi:hypothetical protein
MPTPATRANTHVVALDIESTAFGTIEADFASAKKRIVAWDVVPVVVNESLENQATRQDLGEQPQIKGLIHPGSSFAFSTYAQGLVTPAGDGVVPAETAIERAFVGCFGAVGVGADGSNVAVGSPTTETFDQEAETSSFLTNHVVGVTLDTGEIQARPIRFADLNTINLAIKTTAAPSATNVLYGSRNVLWTEDAARAYIQAESVGRNASGTKQMFGMAGNVAFPETPASQAQTLNFNYQVANGTKFPTVTQVAPTPLRPAVQAGGDFLIGMYNAAAGVTGENIDYLSMSLEFGNEYFGQEQGGTAIGICEWVLTNSTPRWTLTFPRDFDLSAWTDAPPTATTFTEAWELGGLDNDFTLFFQWGKVAGQIMTLWGKRMQIVEEPDTNAVMEGVEVQKVVFGRKAGISTAPFVASFL